MTVEFRGRRYELVRASDVERDGMWLEAHEVSEGWRREVLDAFYSDTSGAMSFAARLAELPFELVEWFVERVRELLPPLAPSDESRPPA